MYAIASKLTGNVDPAKILALAPRQLDELPEFAPLGEPHSDEVGGFEAVDYVGSYVWEGTEARRRPADHRHPRQGRGFVMQLNAEAPKGQEQAVVDAVKLIREQTKIPALPS